MKTIICFLCCLMSCVCVEAKAAKLLVLVVASDNEPIFVEHQKIWRSYMHRYPEQVEAYFVKADPHLSSQVSLNEDVLWVREKECATPGMINKTLAALDFFAPRIGSEFDFVLRATLSSFFVFPRLLEFLETCPREGVYTSGGTTHLYGQGTGQWAHGCGFVLSADVAHLLLEGKSKLYNSPLGDDRAMGEFLLSKKGCELLPVARVDLLLPRDWDLYAHTASEKDFHFRVKNLFTERALSDDLFIYKKLLSHFYPDVLWPCAFDPPELLLRDLEL